MTHLHEARPAPADPRAADEAAHVRRAIAGDRSALEWLLGRFRPFALRVALGLVGNLADAEDVCQDALATVAQRIGQCRQPECFVAWLLRIVRNRAISLLRRGGARTVPLEHAAELPGGEHPERDAEAAELRARLTAALGGLTRLQREVFVLYDVQGWRHAEIAGRLGISEGSARVHLHAARRALRARLAGDAPLDRAA